MSEQLNQIYRADSAEARANRDPEFRALVNTLECFGAQARFTPTELREACTLAATRYELRTNRRQLVFNRDEVSPEFYAEILKRTDRSTPEDG
jgi:hypothetical protein